MFVHILHIPSSKYEKHYAQQILS